MFCCKKKFNENIIRIVSYNDNHKYNRMQRKNYGDETINIIFFIKKLKQ